MVGVLLVTHSQLGEVLLQNAEYIVGHQRGLSAVSQQPGAGARVLKNKVAAELERLENGSGVLVLVDIYGGTPAKVALSFADSHKVAVVTGLNTAMLLKVLEADRQQMALGELAGLAAQSARKSVAVYGTENPPDGDCQSCDAAAVSAESGVATAKVVVLNPMGLHASTSARLVKAASAFKSEITLSRDDVTVNTKSIMGVLMLGATQGTELTLKAVGDDAGRAIGALCELFAARFGEE